MMMWVLSWLAGCSCNESMPGLTDGSGIRDSGLFQPGTPEKMEGRFVDVALSGSHRCGLRDNGALVCWGPQPAPVFDNYRFVRIDGSTNQLCGITAKLDIVCISSARGSTATFVDSIQGGGELQAFSAGPFLAEWCAVTDGRAVCDMVEFEEENRAGVVRGTSTACAWAFGESAVCVEEDYYSKGKYTGTKSIENVFPEWVEIAHATLSPRRCVLDPQGEVECFAEEGQRPLINAPNGPFTRLWAAEDHACALDPEGGIVCWGSEGVVPTPAAKGYTELSMVNQLACAVNADQRIDCWGL